MIKKELSGDFSLYGLGDGDMLFSDIEKLLPPSENRSAFAAATGQSIAGKGAYWKPEQEIGAPALDNFRAMILDRDL